MQESNSLSESIRISPLYSEDLAPIPPEKRTWTMWDHAAIWLGMAVSKPTDLLITYLMRVGFNWQTALTIISSAVSKCYLNPHTSKHAALR